MINLASLFSTKLRRLGYIALLILFALFISWKNVNRIYPDSPATLIESAGVSLLTGFISLPGSIFHLLSEVSNQVLKTNSINSNVYWLIVAFSLVAFGASIKFVIKGSNWAGWVISVYMFMATPYWAYFSYNIMGI